MMGIQLLCPASWGFSFHAQRGSCAHTGWLPRSQLLTAGVLLWAGQPTGRAPQRAYPQNLHHESFSYTAGARVPRPNQTQSPPCLCCKPALPLPSGQEEPPPARPPGRRRSRITECAAHQLPISCPPECCFAHSVNV